MINLAQISTGLLLQVRILVFGNNYKRCLVPLIRTAFLFNQSTNAWSVFWRYRLDSQTIPGLHRRWWHWLSPLFSLSLLTFNLCHSIKAKSETETDRDRGLTSVSGRLIRLPVVSRFINGLMTTCSHQNHSRDYFTSCSSMLQETIFNPKGGVGARQMVHSKHS